MLKFFMIVSLLGAAASEQADCYEHGIDYSGTNINNGLEQHTDFAAECQIHCQATRGCNYFSWVDSSFPDPSYRSTCWLKSDISGRTNNPHVVSGPRMCFPDPTTTTPKPDPTTTSMRPDKGCHDYVYMGSPNHDFFHTMGYMKKQTGKSSYKQIQGGHILKYQAGTGWVVTVSDSVSDLLAYTEDMAECAYETTSTWWYLDHGEWLADSDLRARVSYEEQCNQDAMCAGCGLVLPWNGHDWCCSNDCDYGWIDLLGGGRCVCGH